VRRLCASLLGLTALTSAPALAQEALDDGWVSATQVEEQKRVRSPFAGTRLGVDLLEPLGTSRLQLVSRGIFSDGNSVFSSNAAWSMEARFHLALGEHFGITGVLPFGIVNPGAGETKVFLGNIAIGAAGGGAIDLVDPVESPTPIRLRLGGATELYLPSAPTGSDVTVAAESLLAALRAYEPQLYVPNLLAVRARAHASLSVGNLTAQLELSFVPGALVKAQGDAVFLIGAAGRVAYEVTPVVEPFLEMGATTQVSGAGQIRPPFMLTPGVRLNVTNLLRPAFFMSVNFVSSKALMFGIDLAAAMPKDELKTRGVADDPADFLPD